MTDKKSNELIRKIESLASRHDAKKLQRQVFITGRVKTMNESIYYNVDKLHEAIGTDSQIRFKYYQWNVNKEMELRRDGPWYQTSPWGLMWDDENYYLIAFSAEDCKIKHYRVDKMAQICATGEPRYMDPEAKPLSAAAYGKNIFGMFGRETTTVRMRFHRSLAGVVIDRFGQDTMLIPDGDEHFIFSMDIAVSPLFLGWLAGFGDRAKILSPQSVIDQFMELCEPAVQQYK
jgi:predicted DNA-binding transcriptional regulator YafY